MKKHTKEVKEEAHLNHYGLWSPWLILLWFTSLTCTSCLKFPSKSCESVSMWMPKWIRISITSTFCWSYYGYWIRVVIMWRLEPLTFFCCVCRDQVLLFLELVKCWRWQWNHGNRCGWPFLFWIWWRPVGDDLERDVHGWFWKHCGFCWFLKNGACGMNVELWRWWMSGG